MISSKTSSSDNKEDKGKMIEDENIEETIVGLEVPKKFLKYYGGWKFLFIVTFIFCCFITVKILGDYQVGNWANSPE